MPDDDPHPMWEQLVGHLQQRATASINVLRDSSSDLKIMIVSTKTEMMVSFAVERNAVRWETANEYGFEKLQEPLSRLAMKLMQCFSGR